MSEETYANRFHDGTRCSDSYSNDRRCAELLLADADAQIAALKDDLAEIAAIIESVDTRAAATDGPVTPTLQEMTQAEISRIYAIAAKRAKKGTKV